MVTKIVLNPLFPLMVLLAGMMTLSVLGYLWRAAWRSSRAPVCWNCGAPKVRRSAPHYFLETFFLKPYRCSGCLKRFYGLSTNRHLARRAS